MGLGGLPASRRPAGGVVSTTIGGAGARGSRRRDLPRPVRQPRHFGKAAASLAVLMLLAPVPWPAALGLPSGVLAPSSGTPPHAHPSRSDDWGRRRCCRSRRLHGRRVVAVATAASRPSPCARPRAALTCNRLRRDAACVSRRRAVPRRGVANGQGARLHTWQRGAQPGTPWHDRIDGGTVAHSPARNRRTTPMAHPGAVVSLGVVRDPTGRRSADYYATTKGRAGRLLAVSPRCGTDAIRRSRRTSRRDPRQWYDLAICAHDSAARAVSLVTLGASQLPPSVARWSIHPMVPKR